MDSPAPQEKEEEALNPESKIAVVGSGSWGTAFSHALAVKGLRVTLWARRAELAESIGEKGENPDYLPGITLSPRLRATSDLDEAVDGAGVIVMAVPSQCFRGVVGEIARRGSEAPIVSLAKGLESGTLKRMSEVIAEEIPSAWPAGVAALSGPNLAREIAIGYPAASVIASPDTHLAESLQELFMSPTFRTYAGFDIIGVEIGGVVKNVLAIATGIAEGLSFGDNTKATVITRGLSEMTRLGERLGADPLTFAGLAGIGDLICTCMSGLSRNHQVGLALGRGKPIDEILGGMRQVAEGVKSSAAVKQLSERHSVEMPICDTVYRIVHLGHDVGDAITDLLRTVRKREWE